MTDDNMLSLQVDLASIQGRANVKEVRVARTKVALIQSTHHNAAIRFARILREHRSLVDINPTRPVEWLNSMRDSLGSHSARVVPAARKPFFFTATASLLPRQHVGRPDREGDTVRDSLCVSQLLYLSFSQAADTDHPRTSTSRNHLRNFSSQISCASSYRTHVQCIKSMQCTQLALTYSRGSIEQIGSSTSSSRGHQYHRINPGVLAEAIN